jgi:uncharacterized protein
MDRTRRTSTPLLIAGFLAVAVSMAVLFLVPQAYFIAATYAATTCMIAVTYLLTRYRGLFRPRMATVALGLVTAIGLYLIFYLGNLGVTTLHPFGITVASENSIYSLIASPSNPLYSQVAVLAFDAAGYESFFRGVLQTRLEPRAGVGSVFLVALIDALLHVITLNPLWVVTTFIADSVWGLTYYYSKDLTSSMASHFVWDLVIFILLPIR